MYALTSLIFVVAIAFYKAQLFTFLDDLAVWLRADVSFGYTLLFLLIFITTFPAPLPLYSTLIVLAGYTFGAWAGAILSYLAALAGAIVVFLLSRTLLRGPISRWLDSCPTIKQVVRAVEKRPKLLFLVRLAPYPYNVMNCLLAAAPSLTFRTYTLCTAASLFKLIVHTSLGASIRSFKDYHTSSGQSGETEGTVASAWTIAGVVLCIAILVYLSIVARRAVDDEIGSERETGNAEEREGFLANADGDAADLEAGGARPMVELQR
ncbi:unnamed protein product [Mycena citricolor]|uniref:Golgi apparatus membrane protein TVP38 n=1 Tax=Mycena citricolor TaxID=2018698 RepID=A0AAD2HIX2_9AGAR|nr:unnamed protein product [Mycena citricolor]